MSRGAPRLAGWGRLPAPGREVRDECLERVCRDLPLTRGLGRSYGDASLPPAARPVAAASVLADRILAFDPASGRLRAEAGVTLLELNRLFLPRGWFVPVSPGTQFVTLGGMVAADVHGKNHHVSGTLGRHVAELSMLLADGRVVEASREREADLFRATLGGMGLTGHILEVELSLERIPSPWIVQESRRFESLAELAAALRAASADWPFTVAWLDGLAAGERLGRGTLICGRWASREEAPAAPPRPGRRMRVPFEAPGWLLNPPLMRLHNAVRHRLHPRRARTAVIGPQAFFYPLDAIEGWNRVYGARGFIQYQCVLPSGAAADGVRELLAETRRLGGTPYLIVLKDFGEEGEGLLSFPLPGLTVALDLPVDAGTQALVDGLNRRVIEAGGRIYLAKDAFTRPEDFRRMEPRLERFLEVKRRWDPAGRIASRQWDRLVGAASGPGGPAAELAPVGEAAS